MTTTTAPDTSTTTTPTTPPSELVTAEITDCGAERREWPEDRLIDVTVSGWVRANVAISTGWVNLSVGGLLIGSDDFGPLQTDEVHHFNITGIRQSTDSSVVCSIEWTAVTAD